MDWLKQAVSPGTLLTVGAIVISAAVSHGAHTEREDGIDARLKIVEQKYVPREEHATKDEWVRDSLRNIQQQLQHIETVLMEARK